MKAGKLGFLVLLLMIAPLAAHADYTWGPGSGDCGSCYGATYNLNIVGNPAGDTFTVTLTINTAGAIPGVSGQYISGVGFGDGKDIKSVDLIATTAGPLNIWSETTGNINSSGACDGTPGNKACSQQNSDVSPFQYAKADGSTYSWTWVVVFTTPGLNTNLADIHLSAQYQNQNGSTGHIVSETALTMPEAPLAASLGVGLGLLAFRLRRKK